MNSDDALAQGVLERLGQVVEARKQGDPETSYVARLFQKGENTILKKIGEEATEVVMACKDGQAPQIVGEMADLWFHCLLALSWHGLKPEDVLQELQKREGLSGLDEFAARQFKTREAAEAPSVKTT
jgi:phosphoribosyl-ATP pyrophosphohydrolase